MRTPADVAPAFIDAAPVAGEPGWYGWNLKDDGRFNSTVLGELRVRVGDERVRLRMFPERKHANLQDIVHGATTLALIDVSLFAAMHLLGRDESGMALTLELSTQFVGAGRIGTPLDSVVEVVRETGRLMFLRGDVVQGEDGVAAFSGIVRK